ncbi:MAG: hypothetical protein F6K00_05470 [Leptolyngbya sp. SIOISBB]|nr:hypothetical protein [Leptolyngbya sp. SIOISBB]
MKRPDLHRASFFGPLEIVLIQSLLGTAILSEPELSSDRRGDLGPRHFFPHDIPIDSHHEFGHAILHVVGGGLHHGKASLFSLLYQDLEAEVILALHNIVGNQRRTDFVVDAGEVNRIHLVIGDRIGKHLAPKLPGWLNENATVGVGPTPHTGTHEEFVFPMFHHFHHPNILIDGYAFVGRGLGQPGVVQPFSPFVHLAKGGEGAVGSGIVNLPPPTAFQHHRFNAGLTEPQGSDRTAKTAPDDNCFCIHSGVSITQGLPDLDRGLAIDGRVKRGVPAQ